MSPSYQVAAFDYSQLFMIYIDLNLSKRCLLGKILSVIFLTTITIICLATASQIIISEFSIQNIADSLEGTLLYFQVIMKVVMLNLKRNELKTLMLETVNLWSWSKIGENAEREVKKHHNSMMFILKIYRITLYCSIIFSTTKSFFTNNYHLPVGRWVIPNGTYYETILIAEDLTAPYVVVVIFVFDSLFIVFCVELGIQFQLLAYAFQSIEKESEGDTKIVDQKMTEYIKYHNILLDLFAKINSTYSMLLFYQMLTTSFLICFEMYMLSDSMFVDMGRFINNIVYIGNVLIEISAYFFASQFLLDKVSTVPFGAFDSGWHLKYDSKRTKSVNILIMCSQKSKPIKAAGLYNMDLVTFLQLLKTSYSLFTVIRVVKEKS